MRAQQELGVEVYYCNKQKLPPHARSLCLVDSELRFAGALKFRWTK